MSKDNDGLCATVEAFVYGRDDAPHDGLSRAFHVAIAVEKLLAIASYV